ncbi:hypothetical protein LC092_15380 [Stappia stellulata]|uniref:hypothetical protein n=1 Tax=Stappia TaxID=152161 RepID=UPI001CD5B853|nr:hypothetical protein [Stappia stellulata]MCA1243830.1 hypothetical protein [Stappia stellulata]
MNARTVVVDGLQDIDDGDGFSAFALRRAGIGKIALDVTSGGGRKPHDYTLHVSRMIKEAAPPIIEAKLTLDKHGDRGKAVKSGPLTFDLPDLGVSGSHVFELQAGLDVLRMVIEVGAGADESAATVPSSPPLAIASGVPSDLGDPLLSLDSAEVVSGINGRTLLVGLSHQRACGEASFKAWWDGSFLKSLPPRASVVVVYEAGGDLCEGRVDTTLQIDVDELLDNQGELYIDVHGRNVQSVEVLVR